MDMDWIPQLKCFEETLFYYFNYGKMVKLAKYRLLMEIGEITPTRHQTADCDCQTNKNDVVFDWIDWTLI